MAAVRLRGAALAALAAALSLAAASPGAAPAALPAEERLVYSRRTGDRTDAVETLLALRSEKGRYWYEYSWMAPDEEGLYRLAADGLGLLWSSVTTRGPTGVVRRVTEVLEDGYRPAPDELVIAATGPFLQRLRLIDFEKGRSYRVTFAGSGGPGAFAFTLTVAGRESVAAGGRSWDCFRLELGAGGILGGIFGKTRYWYSVEPPRFLVRSESPGMPGSPAVAMELVSWPGKTAPASLRP